ncbi:site-specific DNA-methyltransferase [uncultured Polaribacter sp.]|uniref:site-specific DNA-methyltransferase n=1 Tax=uncultured Polaribacter sp. TaxID=174711 RepID=UPI002604D753|nr:site-specific DNA-methyltransferase [uncultured Polaribacter sp.]
MANYKKLQNVLTELFQLDKAELDFGIYRIMNQKRDDVLDFLSNKLPKEVRAILEGQQKGDATQLKKDLDNAIKTAKEFGVDPETNPKVLEAKAAYEAAGSIEGLEQEVFSHLASFFKRYYDGGDFVSLRRYKKDVYAIPYEGEEVKLHWANHDQYYIKTSENLKNYAFKVDGDKTVKFTLKEANTEQNNNKNQKDQERRFALFTEEPVTIDGETIHINFTYELHKKSIKQDKLIDSAVEQLTDKVPADFAKLFSLAPTEKNKKRTLLEKHLVDFSARNTFDYFIHKDLGCFLTRELDFYIKNEVLFIDDINTDNELAFATQLSKIRALKQVASKIITFLAQLENFQKKLWLKKKFVVSCDYCITLDKIPDNYYSEIIENTAQLEEWKTLFNVEIKTLEELKEESYLVLDTKFFSQEFKDKLLAEFDDLDEQINGVLINSENFHGLNTLQSKYQDNIKCVYTDPPYNTGEDGFPYKDNFQSSSWISFMIDRLFLSRNLISNDGFFVSNIDEHEHLTLELMLKSVFGDKNEMGKIIWDKRNPKGDAKGIGVQHEYYQLAAKDFESNKNKEDFFVRDKPNALKILAKAENLIKKYGKVNADVREEFRKWVNKSDFSGGEKAYKLLDEEGNVYQPVSMSWPNKKKAPDEYFTPLIHPKTNTACPVPQRGWRNPPSTMAELMKKGLILFGDDESTQPRRKYLLKENLTENVSSLYYFGGSDDSFFEDIGFQFDNPKPVKSAQYIVNICARPKESIVLDYFAGSGTTGHATIKLNREDQGNRKYILLEMGEYINTVTKPRIQKVIYTDNWKNGKPQDKEGISQMFKYFNLESYEDALNNLQLKPNQAQQQVLDTNADLQEEYLLQYMLDVETREHLMNIEAFKNPFNYKLNITENNELVPTTIDLVETFNYLIGLHVKRVQRIGAFKTVEGVTNDGDKVLVIWRNLEESTNDDLNAFVKKMDYNLRDGEFDTIYVNGDNNLANLKQDTYTWKVLLLEEMFFTLMFDVKDV